MLEAKNLNKEISIKKIDDETLNVKIFNNDILAEIVGEFNKLRNSFSISIIRILL